MIRETIPKLGPTTEKQKVTLSVNRPNERIFEEFICCVQKSCFFLLWYHIFIVFNCVS